MEPRCCPTTAAAAFGLGLWPLQGLCTRSKRLLEVPERSKLKSVIQQRSDSERLERPVPSLQNPLEEPNQETPKDENYYGLRQEWDFPWKVFNPRFTHSFLSFPGGKIVSPALEGHIRALPCPWATCAPAAPAHVWPSPAQPSP